MDIGNVEKLMLIGVIVGLVVTYGTFIHVDFANTYGFSNQTDSVFTNFVDYDSINSTIANYEAQSQTPQEGGILQFLTSLAQLIFGGAYTAFKSLFGLTNTLTTITSNAFTLMGIPDEFKGYVYGAITIIVVSSILVAVGVARRQ